MGPADPAPDPPRGARLIADAEREGATVRANESPTGNGRKLGILLAIFDFPMLNVGFRAVIGAEPDMAVVGEVDERGSMRERVASANADIVIAECEPFAGGGCTTSETIDSIRAIDPGVRIVALECRCSGDQFSRALKAGADGFLTREAQPADVVAALRCVSRGQTYVSPAIVTRMVNTYVLKASDAGPRDPYESLSDREREVLLLAAVGHTNREIARTFHVSEQTVHNYRANIMEKLGFHDRLELLKFALRRGVISPADL
jgi:DNA-binding NarL/FixJ family response regulator